MACACGGHKDTQFSSRTKSSLKKKCSAFVLPRHCAIATCYGSKEIEAESSAILTLRQSVLSDLVEFPFLISSCLSIMGKHLDSPKRVVVHIFSAQSNTLRIRFQLSEFWLSI